MDLTLSIELVSAPVIVIDWEPDEMVHAVDDIEIDRSVFEAFLRTMLVMDPVKFGSDVK